MLCNSLCLLAIVILFQDAVDPYTKAPIENNYASVADILPAGRLHHIRSVASRKQDETGVVSSEYHSHLILRSIPMSNRVLGVELYHELPAL